MAESSGIVNISDGKSFSWFAEGKTEMSVKNNLEIVYGTATSVAIGMKNEFFLGHASEVTIGSKIGVSLGPEFTLTESSQLDSKETDSSHYMTAFTSTVGASPTQILAMKKLRYLAFVLVGAQTALMIASAIMATVRLKQDPESKELYSPGVGITMTVLPQIAAVGTGLIVALLAFKKKWGSLKDMGSPAAALSLDVDGGVFLGSRKTLPTASHTAGVLINETGVQISTAKTDLTYSQPTGSESIIGFSLDADNHGGTRVEFGNDGGTRLFGETMTVALKGSNKAVNLALAEEHLLKVTSSNSLTPTLAGVGISKDGILLQRDATTAISAQDGSVNAIVGGAAGSALRLTSSGASLSNGQNFVSVDAQGVYLRFGGATMKVNSTSLDLSGNLTVLVGSPPGPFTGLADAIRDIGTLNTALQATYTARKFSDTAFDVARNATNTANETLITARDASRGVLESLKWPTL